MASISPKLHFEGPQFYIRQFHTNCIYQFSYYLQSGTWAAIIDPVRDSREYIKLAEERGAKIKYIFLTRVPSDYISGYHELLKILNKKSSEEAQTPVQVVCGPENPISGENIYAAKDQEEMLLGQVKLIVLHTPGRTVGSSCFALKFNGEARFLFSGDTINLGDVGRADTLALPVKKEFSGGDEVDVKLDPKILAGRLFDSIQKNILPLPPAIVILPGHGDFSPIGKKIQPLNYDTLGNQLASQIDLDPKQNTKIQIEPKDPVVERQKRVLGAPPLKLLNYRTEFITNLTHEIPPPLKHYEAIYNINCTGKTADGNQVLTTQEFLKKNKKLSVEEFAKLAEDSQYVAFDYRQKNEFLEGFIPRSLHLQVAGFPIGIWIGRLQKPDIRYIAVTTAGKEEELLLRLSRVGFENFEGFLEGGYESWVKAKKQFSQEKTVSAKEFKELFINKKVQQVLDVRAPGEMTQGYVEGAVQIPLNKLEETLIKENQFKDKPEPLYVYCKSGTRATHAISLLSKYGTRDIVNIDGGRDALLNEEFPFIY